MSGSDTLGGNLFEDDAHGGDASKSGTHGGGFDGGGDGYYVAYKPITFSCILFMFIEMKFIHCHSCMMFTMKSMSMCND